jgi:2-isopropylmalate synthase
MDAGTIGLSQSKLVLGKHSGRHAFRVQLEQMGYHLDEKDLAEVFRRFKDLADTKKVVTDSDLIALIGDELYQPPEVWQVEDIQVNCGTTVIPTAVVRLRNVETGELFTDAGFGTGPVDAVYQGINRLVGVPNKLVEFVIQAIDQGMDAVGDVTIRIESEELVGTIERAQGGRGQRIFSGRGIDTDIVVASAKAYMQALNKLLAAKEERESVVALGV